MPFDISGTVKEIFEVQTFANDFKKREFLLTTESDKYPQNIIFGCLKDKIELLNSIKTGQEVKVHFDISCREWNEKYFVNLNAWKIESLDSIKDSPDTNLNTSDIVLDEEPPF